MAVGAAAGRPTGESSTEGCAFFKTGSVRIALFLVFRKKIVRGRPSESLAVLAPEFRERRERRAPPPQGGRESALALDRSAGRRRPYASAHGACPGHSTRLRSRSPSTWMAGTKSGQ